MPEQLELFGTPEAAARPAEKRLEDLSDAELAERLAAALQLGSIGTHYNKQVEGKWVLDRERVIEALKNPEEEKARRYQETLAERESGPGGVD